MDPANLLDDVTDWQSFAAFVRALAAEREQAEQLEKEKPVYYQLGGALNWQNGQISDFLECALACVEGNEHRKPVPAAPSWRFLADFLYGGKIYE
jgi:hypothetical protein